MGSVCALAGVEIQTQIWPAGAEAASCVWGLSQPAVADTFEGQMDTQGRGDLRSHHTHYRFDLYCDALLGQESVRKV